MLTMKNISSISISFDHRRRSEYAMYVPLKNEALEFSTDICNTKEGDMNSYLITCIIQLFCYTPSIHNAQKISFT